MRKVHADYIEKLILKELLNLEILDEVKLLVEFQKRSPSVHNKVITCIYEGFSIQRKCDTQVLLVEHSRDNKPNHCGDKTCFSCNKFAWIYKMLKKVHDTHVGLNMGNWAPVLFYVVTYLNKYKQ